MDRIVSYEIVQLRQEQMLKEAKERQLVSELRIDRPQRGQLRLMRPDHGSLYVLRLQRP